VRGAGAHVDAEDEGAAVEDLAMRGPDALLAGPPVEDGAVAHERHADPAHAGPDRVHGDPHLDRRARGHPQRLPRNDPRVVRRHAPVPQLERPLAQALERVEPAALEGVERGGLALLAHQEHGLDSPDRLAAGRVESRLAEAPGRPAPLAGREFEEEPIPPAAGLLEARGLRIEGAERRVPVSLEQIVGVRVGAPGHAHAGDRATALVGRLGKRPHGGAAEALDMVDERLVGGDAEILPGRIGVDGERPRPDQGGHAHEDQDPAQEPGPAPLDHDRPADAHPPHAPHGEQRHPRHHQQRRQAIHQRLPPIEPHIRITDRRQRAQGRGLGDAEH
jgi:hypothetical protein